MSAYTRPLAYKGTAIFRDGRRLVEITRGFAYRCERTGRSYNVETGMLTDLGSIPALARVFLSPDAPYAQAFVVHDALYHTKSVSRRTADLILRDALALPYRIYDEAGVMRRARCPWLARWAIYFAVRLGGWRNY